MKTFTTFCQQADGKGTIHITSVKARNLKGAIAAGRRECHADWGGRGGEYKLKDIHCLGVAEGDVTILHWQDLYC